jgi:hypothetical protein
MAPRLALIGTELDRGRLPTRYLGRAGCLEGVTNGKRRGNTEDPTAVVLVVGSSVSRTQNDNPLCSIIPYAILSQKMAGCTHLQPPALALPGILVWALLWAINFKKPCFGRKAVLSPALGFSPQQT